MSEERDKEPSPGMVADAIELVEDYQAQMSQLAEQAGMDTEHCEFCEELLDATRPWRRGLDGMGAHEDCLDRWLD